MKLRLAEIANVAGVSAVPQRVDVEITGWSVDSRSVQPGDLFFALRGPHHDGNAYVTAALAAGAVAAVVEEVVGDPDRLMPLTLPVGRTPWSAADALVGLPCGRPDVGSIAESGSGGTRADQGVRPTIDAESQRHCPDRLLVVPDSLRALQAVAGWARARWGGTMVAVTGSAGKTTTKDAIAHLLAVELAVGKTCGNFNNHVGVPLSILRLPDSARAAVLELGMNHAGEIRELAAIARPRIGVVTNVGYAHVEFFDSIEDVALAKRELIEALPADGMAVLNADDARVLRFQDVHPGRSITFGFGEKAEVRAEQMQSGGAGTRFRAAGVDFETSLMGRHGVMNLLAAIAVARVFGIAPERLRDAVRTFALGSMRGERLEHHGVTIWNDCYNSNPDAARAMLDVLAGTPARHRVAVLGEMLELGHSAEDLHRDVGRYVAERGIDVLIGVRGAARAMVDQAVRAGMSGGAAYFFEDAREAGEFVRQVAKPGDAVLFKGSRGVAVERALERLLA